MQTPFPSNRKNRRDTSNFIIFKICSYMDSSADSMEQNSRKSLSEMGTIAKSKNRYQLKFSLFVFCCFFLFFFLFFFFFLGGGRASKYFIRKVIRSISENFTRLGIRAKRRFPNFYCKYFLILARIKKYKDFTGEITQKIS